MEKKTLPNINANFSDWYNEVVFAAELADQAPVRGCMVIRPYGYALWENITKILDKKIKDTGHHNAAFPLLIPQSFIQKEKEHVAGFAPELAIVTHAGGKELEEPLVVRPTSETIIHYMFAQWLHSWRDLPIKINQWASVVRWEMRARPFLRTTEFWWQEGHTAHETEEEALTEAQTMLGEYVDLVENYLAIPVITGQKSATERFAGATATYTLEGVMPDGKALQMGTSHMISQSFAHAFDMKYQNREGQEAYPYLTSWGVTTRLIGALIMTHGDDKGLIIPPRVAPYQVVIVPITRPENRSDVLTYTEGLKQELASIGIRVICDANDQATPGAKYYHWELRGVPLRIEVGPRDMAAQQVTVVNRLTGAKSQIARAGITAQISRLLEELQDALLARAKERRAALWHKSASVAEFGPRMEAEGGVYQTGWCLSVECEQAFKGYKGTTRCLVEERTQAMCAVCGKESLNDVLVAKAY